MEHHRRRSRATSPATLCALAAALALALTLASAPAAVAAPVAASTLHHRLRTLGPSAAAAAAVTKEDAVVPLGEADADAGRQGPRGSHRRVRRQNGEVVESIFQIPIQTLQAVSKAFSTGIQTIQRTREQFFQATRPGVTSLTSSGASSGSSVYTSNYLQQQQQAYKPYKPYKPSRPSGSGAYSSAYAYTAASGLTRPNNYVYYNYQRPRGGASSAYSAAGQQQSHAASVAGVAAQSDGSSFRI